MDFDDIYVLATHQLAFGKDLISFADLDYFLGFFADSR